MGSSEKSRAFDPLDLEIIDLVYEVAWEQIAARQPAAEDVEEWQASLRTRVFALAGGGEVNSTPCSTECLRAYLSR